MTRCWTLTFHVECDAAEAERIFDAMHAVACDCKPESEEECRCPVSGMRPWASMFDHPPKIEPVVTST